MTINVTIVWNDAGYTFFQTHNGPEDTSAEIIRIVRKNYPQRDAVVIVAASTEGKWTILQGPMIDHLEATLGYNEGHYLENQLS